MRHVVNTPPPSGADGPAPPLVGARFHAQATPAEPAADGGGPTSPRFPIVLRGYERRQVDREFEVAQAEVERVRAELRAEQHQRQAMWARAAALDAQLRHLQSTAGEQGVDRVAPEGPLADKLLRMARRDAARIRAEAAQEASRVIEEARAQADRHRRETEQSMAEWVASVERDVTDRVADAQSRGAHPDPVDEQAV